uniref:Ubiquitin-conjugating enzyme E2Q-like protein 1 n=1 Tax=Paramormyrops kingsleyae TaxID=1676925 RepID=A0A3B3Q929_9TELE|nr:ubiquitin-conjugating enzyme E2Q-like protein 1 [Paramormyrops kingsleyae]
MATLLRKIGVSRISEKDADEALHHQGSCKGGRSSVNPKLNNLKPCNTSNEKTVCNPPEARSKTAEEEDRQSVRGKQVKEKQAVKAGTAPGRAHGPQRQECHQLRTKRLMKELQDIKRLGDSFITVELADDNLFEWHVKLHQVDKDSALWQDMKETQTDFISVSISFPDNFPFQPPFMRVLTPRLENGYILDGGAICMELLTPRGWSSAYTVEAVMRQFAASLVKGQGRICRKTGKSKKAFSRKEAEATFRSLVKTHEKYGWVSPPVSDG